jgi:hypothetical protein
MSATNRGKPREAADFYPTDPRITVDFLRRCPLPPGRWVEPAVGDGAIVRAVESWRGGDQFWSVADIRPDAPGLDMRPRLTLNMHAACVDWASPLPTDVDWAFCDAAVYITNPPFSLAETFARRCIERGGPDAFVCLLLRVGILGSRERIDFWREHPNADMYPIVPRPSFGLNKHGKPGTDASEYAWFVWGPGCTGKVHHPTAPWKEGRGQAA